MQQESKTAAIWAVADQLKAAGIKVTLDEVLRRTRRRTQDVCDALRAWRQQKELELKAAEVPVPAWLIEATERLWAEARKGAEDLVIPERRAWMLARSAAAMESSELQVVIGRLEEERESLEAEVRALTVRHEAALQRIGELEAMMAGPVQQVAESPASTPDSSAATDTRRKRS